MLQNKLSSYLTLSVLGKDAFSEVLLVKDKQTQKLLALKIIKKLPTLFHQIQMEKEVYLSSAGFPFIGTLFECFQTKKRVFLVLEYCPGGNLRALLNNLKLLTEDQARFLACQIVLGLEFFHLRGYVLLDLKPDNLLINQ